jgi:hypothetical protein
VGFFFGVFAVSEPAPATELRRIRPTVPRCGAGVALPARHRGVSRNGSFDS